MDWRTRMEEDAVVLASNPKLPRNQVYGSEYGVTGSRRWWYLLDSDAMDCGC